MFSSTWFVHLLRVPWKLLAAERCSAGQPGAAVPTRV